MWFEVDGLSLCVLCNILDLQTNKNWKTCLKERTSCLLRMHWHQWISINTTSFHSKTSEPNSKKKWRVAALTCRRKAWSRIAEDVEPLAAIADPRVTTASLMVSSLSLSLFNLILFLNCPFFLPWTVFSVLYWIRCDSRFLRQFDE